MLPSPSDECVCHAYVACRGRSGLNAVRNLESREPRALVPTLGRIRIFSGPDGRNPDCKGSCPGQRARPPPRLDYKPAPAAAHRLELHQTLPPSRDASTCPRRQRRIRWAPALRETLPGRGGACVLPRAIKDGATGFFAGRPIRVCASQQHPRAPRNHVRVCPYPARKGR
jgi:hypothetical protein